MFLNTFPYHDNDLKPPFDAGELGCTMFGYIPDAFQNDLPQLPSESASRQAPAATTSSGSTGVASAASTDGADSTRSNSPRPE